MRIGWPARKHGVADDDIAHAFRYRRRQLATEDGYTAVIGPARDGALLELGVVDLDPRPALIQVMP